MGLSGGRARRTAQRPVLARGFSPGARRRQRPAARSFRRRRGGRGPGARPRTAGGCRPAGGLDPACRQIRRGPGAGRGRRLRPGRTASEFRHRHHGAVAEERFRRLAIRHRKIPDLPLGYRPRGRAQRAFDRRLPARESRRHQRGHHPLRSAAPGRTRVAVRRHAPRTRTGPALVLAGFFRGQGQGTDRAASPLLRHRLQSRAERQIEPGRSARHPDHRLGGEAPLRHRHPR